jgi:hypothetical protein
VTEEDYQKAISAQNFVEVRNVLGGPAPEETARQRNASYQVLRNNETWVSKTYESLKGYSTKLNNDVALCINHIKNNNEGDVR